MPRCAVGPPPRESVVSSHARAGQLGFATRRDQVVQSRYFGGASITMAGRRSVPAHERP